MGAPNPSQGDPRVPHPQQSALGAEGARKARHQATIVASLAAVVPTVLAMQGMASLAMDVLKFSMPVAIALAGFLELALVSSALLARASALAGRPGGADAVAVWVVSIASGTLAATHEFVGPAVGGVRGWEFDSGSLLAAGVRVTAPLVAAWLWERVLTAARREHAQRTLVELRRDHRLLGVARAALAVRRLEVDHDSPSDRRHASRLRRARRRLDRAHVAALRTVPPGAANLSTWLAAVGAVDILPAATIVRDLDILTTADQCEPARGPGDRQEWTTPDHVGHQGPAQGGPGWSTEPETGLQLTQDVGHRATEPAAEPRTEPVLGHSGPVQNQAGPLVDLVGRGPVVAAAEATIRDANVLELWAGGMSQRNIATHLGISRSTVGRAVTRGNASEPPARERVESPNAEMAPVDQQPTGGGGSLIQTGLLDHGPAREPVQ